VTISPAQRKVLGIMADGYELQHRFGRWTLKDTNGWRLKIVPSHTARVLVESKLVTAIVQGLGLADIYVLNEAGHAALGPAADALEE
jgi:hypothetical protein